MKTEILRFEHVSAILYGNQILDNASLTIFSDELIGIFVHEDLDALALTRLISGSLTPSKGEIYIDNHPVGTLKQHLFPKKLYHLSRTSHLVKQMSAGENIFLNLPRSTSSPWLDKKQIYALTSDLLSEYQVFYITPDAIVSQLDIFSQHVVEILKAAASGVRILVIDQIVQYCSKKERALLFSLVEKLRAKHITVCYISTQYIEAFEQADRIAIMDDGFFISVLDRRQDGGPLLPSLFQTRYSFPANFDRRLSSPGKQIMEAVRLSFHPDLHPLSFSLRTGEILGLYDESRLMSQTLSLPALPRHLMSGQLYLNGKQLLPATRKQLLAGGLAIIPPTDPTNTTFDNMSLVDNITLHLSSRCYAGPFIRPHIDQYIARQILKRIHSEKILEQCCNQKRLPLLSKDSATIVSIARWLGANPDVLLFINPFTNFNEQGCIEFLTILQYLSQQGIAVILCNVDKSPLEEICDSILIVERNR